MGRASALTCLALLSACLQELPELDDPCAPWERTGVYSLTLDRPDTKKRKAIVWVPEGAGPRPVVTMLHGAGQTNDDIQQSTQWIRYAGSQGAVVVFPQGILQSWNAGSCCAFASESNKDVDDVGYLEELARTVRERTCGSDHLVAGFSNGAMMAHRWACEGEQVDGLLPSSGPLLQDASTCSGPPLPVRHYHGAEDTTVPAQGGPRPSGAGSPYPSAADTMQIWRDRNACSESDPVVTVEGDTVCEAWDCAVDTELCLVDGHGHSWPGGTNRGPNQHDATVDGFAWFLTATE